MSLVFEPPWTRKGAPPQVSTVQRLLDENNQLIIKIRDLQNQGAPDRAEAFQKKLHRNLVFLAKAADKFHNSYKEQQEQPQQEQESLEQHKLEKTPVPSTDMVYEEVDRTADPNLWLMFAPPPPQNRPDPAVTIQKLLDENSQLIKRIQDFQAQNRTPEELAPHQELLHRNLCYIAKATDPQLFAELTAPKDGAPPPPENAFGAPPPQQPGGVPPGMPPPGAQQMPPMPVGMPPQQPYGAMPPHPQYPPYPQQGMVRPPFPGPPYDPQQMPPQMMPPSSMPGQMGQPPANYNMPPR